MMAPGGIVWLASFPKSGNTWFRILLANLAMGERGPADINNLETSGGIASSRQEFEAETMLDSGLLSHDDIDCLRPKVHEAIARDASDLRWIKVHDAFTKTKLGEPLLGRSLAQAAVYLVRDPRDVAVSLAHHNGTTVDEAIELINSPDGAICGGHVGQALQLRQRLTGWSGHVTSWLDHADFAVHLLRYEDLVSAPVQYFSAALGATTGTAPTEDIERAVRHADFSELQRQEGEKGFTERVSSSAPFFRAGRVGGWRTTLSNDQVIAIEQRQGAVMARLGYEVLNLQSAAPHY